MGGTVGMYGDLPGIAGKSLQEIDGLEWRASSWIRESASPRLVRCRHCLGVFRPVH